MDVLGVCRTCEFSGFRKIMFLVVLLLLQVSLALCLAVSVVRVGVRCVVVVVAVVVTNLFLKRVGTLWSLSGTPLIHGADPNIEVPMDALAGAMVARRVVRDILNDPRIETLKDIVRVMRKNQAQLEAKDRFIRLELAWIGTVGEQLKDYVSKQILACMPREDRLLTIAQSLDKLHQLKSSEAVTFGGVANNVASVIAVVSNISCGITPDNKLAD
jgi:hypothetical protein